MTRELGGRQLLSDLVRAPMSASASWDMVRCTRHAAMAQIRTNAPQQTTLRCPFLCILGGSTKAKGGSRKARNTSETVDIVTERLIELLTTLETETAITAVAGIVRRFRDANWLPAAERKKAA